MQANKENLTSKAPRSKELKKRQSLSSPFSAASPGVRPLQKKVKPFREIGDPNLDATHCVDESFNMSSIKFELDGSAACKAASFTTTPVFHGDSNMEESLLEESDMQGNKMSEGKSYFCGVVDGNLEESAVESTICGADLNESTRSGELDDTINKTITCVETGCTENIVKVKPISVIGGLNVNTTNSVNESFNISDVKLKLDESDACQSAAFSTTHGFHGDSKIEQSVLEQGDIHEDQVNEGKSYFCGVVDGNLEETAVESTVCGADLSESTRSGELDDTIDKTITCVETECTENIAKVKSRDKIGEQNLDATRAVDGSLEMSSKKLELDESPECQSASFSRTPIFHCNLNIEDSVPQQMDMRENITIEDVNRAKELGELELGTSHESETHVSATFNVSVVGDVSMLETKISEISEMPAGSEVPFSPIADLSKKTNNSTVSTSSALLDSQADHLPAFSRNKKYNLNDSDISFLMNENRVYDMDLREADQLRKNLAILQGEKTVILEKLRSVSGELEEYKSKSAVHHSELLEANRKLDELARSKEYAEKTVADYEFIVQDLKMRHAKQKECLFAKVLTLEDELDKLRASCQSESELKITSTSLKTELSLANERLLLAEEEKAIAEERCEKLTQELQLTLSTAASYENEVAIANKNTASLAAKLAIMEKVVEEKDVALAALQDDNKNECLKMEMKLKEAENALLKSQEKVVELSKQLAASEDNIAVIREAHTTSEMELMNIKDELKRVKVSLEESEECRSEVSTRCFTFENELNSARMKLDLFEEVSAAVEKLRSESALLHEQLSAEKLAYSVLREEVVQLRQENDSCNEALKQANLALSEAEARATAAEKDITEHTRCHAETVEALVKAKAEIADLRKAKEDFWNEMVSLKQSHDNHVAEREKLAAILTELKPQVELLKCERDDLKDKMQVANERHEKSTTAANEMIESLKSDVAFALSERDLLSNQLAAAEDSKRIVENKLTEITVALSRSQAELDALVAEKILVEKKLTQQENEHMEKIMEFNKMRASMMELEANVDVLKSEARSKSEELLVVNERLKDQITANEQMSNAFASLEQENLLLKQEKESFNLELEEQKKRYTVEITTAQMIAEDLKEKLAKLQSHLVTEEAATQRKMEEMNTRVSRLELENSEYKELRAEADMQLTQMGLRCQELVAEKEQLETRLSEANARADRVEIAEKRSNDFESELKELREELEFKTREVDRLGGLCDEFDEIENNYRQELFAVIKERDQLKAQLSPSSAPEVPNLEVAFTEGMEMLDREKSLVHNVEDLNVKATESEDIMKEIEDLRRRCAFQERRIDYLEKICDEADESEEKLKSEITELKKEVAYLKGSNSSNASKTTAPPLQDVLSSNSSSSGMCGDDKPASSSQESRLKSLDVSAGPITEESVIEGVGTPNRTLRTVFHKGFDKTAKLSDSPGGTKVNTSRCAQQ